MNLTPGMHITPGDFSYRIGKLTQPDGSVQIVLHLEHSTGSTTIPMPMATATDLGDKLMQAGTGLHITKEMP